MFNKLIDQDQLKIHFVCIFKYMYIECIFK